MSSLIPDLFFVSIFSYNVTPATTSYDSLAFTVFALIIIIITYMKRHTYTHIRKTALTNSCLASLHVNKKSICNGTENVVVVVLHIHVLE